MAPGRKEITVNEGVSVGVKRPAIKTKKQEIIAHWETRIEESGLSFDWAEADQLCWKCGCKRKTERCHIVPHQTPLCGPDSPDNFVLLCRECHELGPNVSDPDAMWEWLRRDASPFYGLFWIQQAFLEYVRRHGELTPEQVAILADPAVLHSAIASAYAECGIHFGRGYTLETRVWAIRRMVEIARDMVAQDTQASIATRNQEHIAFEAFERSRARGRQIRQMLEEAA